MTDRRKEYIDLIQPHLPELYNFIRRELAYHQALDDLAPSDAGADEILDATIVRGYEEFEARPERLEVFPWLSKLALGLIQQASLRSRERFWDIRVPKIDSIFDNSLVPRPSWSPGVPPQHRKLVAATHRSPI